MQLKTLFNTSRMIVMALGLLFNVVLFASYLKVRLETPAYEQYKYMSGYMYTNTCTCQATWMYIMYIHVCYIWAILFIRINPWLLYNNWGILAKLTINFCRMQLKKSKWTEMETSRWWKKSAHTPALSQLTTCNHTRLRNGMRSYTQLKQGLTNWGKTMPIYTFSSLRLAEIWTTLRKSWFNHWWQRKYGHNGLLPDEITQELTWTITPSPFPHTDWYICLSV